MTTEILKTVVRRLAASCAGCFLVLALAGCGRESTSAAPAAPRQTTVTALLWAPDWSEEMHAVAAAFSREHPDIRIDLQFMIGNSVEENLKPKVAANQLPDLISVNPNAYAAALADQGILADVGRSAAWTNMRDLLKSEWTSPARRHFGVAGGIAATPVYYNKKMFKLAGITRLPENFDEFLDTCARLKKAGFTPLVLDGAFPNMLANGPFSAGFANNIAANRPDWRRAMAAGELDLDTPAMADIFARIKLLAERGYVQEGYMNTGYDDGIRLFTEGHAAMAFEGSWAAGRLMGGKGFEAGVFIPPWNAAGKPAVPVIGSETGFAVCDTKNKEAALLFLDFMFGKGFGIQQNKRQNIPPMKDPSGNMVIDPQITAYVRAAEEAYPLTGAPYYAFLPASTIEFLHPLLQDVLSGKVMPRQAAASLDASVRASVRRIAGAN
ncbi:MAG TPA: ABC transporter substrate-binding protein [Janthinobacterium sp.]|nr:ABC transporter substrate-binding protein [Janthinobacterium sp.]